jgi:transketolase C-terminal domain/subunit
MSEQIGAVFIFAGLAALAASGLWATVRGLGVLLRSRSWRQLLAPLAMAGMGLAVGLTPFVAQRVWLAVVGLGERERVIDGERALNLTGWDRDGYDILATKPDVAILEMGNADVTDETLDLLAALPNLRELTLNDAAVTDAGLATLARLPKLESLRIARTKITPEGVQRFLDAPPPNLRQVDVSGNDVPTAILRRWKNAAVDAGAERRYVN